MKTSSLVVHLVVTMGIFFLPVNDALPQISWIFFENRTTGTAYIRTGLDLDNEEVIAVTMVDLSVPDVISVDGKSEEFYSFTSLEEFRCSDRSRVVLNLTAYSKPMATGRELKTITVPRPERYRYPEEEWISKGYQKMFCKSPWEFWR